MTGPIDHPEPSQAIILRCPKCRCTSWQLLLEDPESASIHGQCSNCGLVWDIMDYSPGAGIRDIMPWF